MYNLQPYSLENTSVKPYQFPFKKVQYKVIPLAHIYLSYSLNPSSDGYNKGITDTRTSTINISSAAYADDLTAIANKLETLQTQLNKLDKICEWAGMDLGISKCAMTGCPNKSKLHPTTFKALIQATIINYINQPILTLNKHEPYTYLG